MCERERETERERERERELFTLQCFIGVWLLVLSSLGSMGWYVVYECAFLLILTCLWACIAHRWAVKVMTKIAKCTV